MTAPTVTLPVGDNAGAEEKGPKKSKKKLIIILVVVLLAGAFGAKTFLLTPKKKVSAPVPGAVLTIDDATINLAAGHYLRLGLSLQLEGKLDPTTIDGSAASDLANSYFTDRTESSLITAAGRDKAKATLEAQIEALPQYKGKVMGIYFEHYVMQ
jgi:flagellar FliL protein